MVSAQQRASNSIVIPQAHVLVIGPQMGALQDLLRVVLMRRGHRVDFASSTASAAENGAQYDLLMIEIDPHNADTMQLCARVRQETLTPLLVLVPETARNQGVQALELGGDMFITIPFDRRELVARVEALVRRNRLGPPLPQAG